MSEHRQGISWGNVGQVVRGVALLIAILVAGCAVNQPVQKPSPPLPQLSQAAASRKINPRTERVLAPAQPRTNFIVVHWESRGHWGDATHWRLPDSTSLESSNDLVHWQQLTNFPIRISPFPADGFTVALPARDEPFRFFRVRDNYQ